jgi:TetR/AcrR family transcriptional repressor of nem operon
MPEAAPTPARIRLMNAAMGLFRERGYADTAVDDLCRAAGVSKGTFFHYFASKEALASAAVQHWNEETGALFAGAPYQTVSDPRERLLAYLDFRAQLVCGELPEFTCLLGTLAQEVFATHPTLAAACGSGMKGHIFALLPMVEEAKARYAAQADWSAESLARYTQVVIQGSFVLAKALQNPQVVHEAIEHLKQYVQQMLPLKQKGTK